MGTFRINIRDYITRDADKIADWVNDKEMTQWFTFADVPPSKTEIVVFVNNQIKNVSSKPLYKNFVLYDLKDREKKYIGSVGLKNIDYKKKQADITIVISNRNYLDKGYGQEALHLICKYGFLTLRLIKINIHCISHNERAKKAYRKYGFRNEKLLKNNIIKMGKKTDEIAMSIEKKAFAQKI